jgi:histidinol-phosphate aminotransferase
MYSLATRSAGREEIRVPLTSGLEYDLGALSAALKASSAIKILFLANPNNPTGTYINSASLGLLLGEIPSDVVLVIDEAYAEYVRASDYPQALALVSKRPRTVVLRTFSKVYGLAGLRIAYAVCDPEIASLLQRVKEPFNVSSVAQAAAFAALDDHEHLKISVQNNASEMERLAEGLSRLGLAVTPSQANFMLVNFPDAKVVHQSLMQKGIVTRPVVNYGLVNALRITIGKPAENEALLKALYSLKSR